MSPNTVVCSPSIMCTCTPISPIQFFTSSTCSFWVFCLSTTIIIFSSNSSARQRKKADTLVTKGIDRSQLIHSHKARNTKHESISSATFLHVQKSLYQSKKSTS